MSPTDRDVVAFTRQLVRIRSTADVGEAAVAEAVAARMRGFGWEPIVQDVAPGRPNVVAVLDGGGGPGPTLMLEGHTDVVTEGHEAAWSVPPYEGVLRNGRLYGRGAADMKSGLAAILFAARAVELAGPFPGRLVVAALVDEEGMMAGAKAFAATPLAAEVTAAMIAEPEGGEICPVAKGALRVRIDLIGTMAHGAMPEQGRNPLPAAARLLTALEDYERELQKEHPRHPHLGQVYLTPTVMNAGSLDQLNVIPARCTVGIDVRTVPAVEHRTIVARLTQLAESVGAPLLSTHVEVIDDRPAVDTPLDDPLVTALAAAHESVTGEPPRFGGVPGATDGTILGSRLGVPTVVYGPGGKWIAHQADEYVDIDDIVTCTEVFARAARRYLEGSLR